jgi:hypothetical protein
VPRAPGLVDVRLRLVRNVRVTSLPNVEVVRVEVKGPASAGMVPVALSFDTQQSMTDAVANLWRIRVSALPEAASGPTQLLDIPDMLERFPQRSAYRLSGTTYAGLFEVREELAVHLTSARAPANATSIWFEDIVGHVSTPDDIIFSP